MPYHPEKILVEKSALRYRFCQEILNNQKTTPTEIIDSEDRLETSKDHALSLSQGKRVLYLKEFKGSAFKLCPGYSESVLCCNYFVLDLVENCPLECSYCILQVFLNKPLITFHVNVESIIESMIKEIKQYPNRPFRIGTGEHSDSLALDHIFRVNPYLVETFANLPNATLELKSKTDAIESLIGLEHRGRTVVAWSLNPSEIIQSNEHKTATLQQRLNAASRLVDNGYRVAFHFDPLIHYPEWEDGYFETINDLFCIIKPQDIAWISLGTLRYIPKLKQIAEERFPKTAIFANEFVSATDGKMRYIKPIRKKMLAQVSGWIREKAPQVPLYLCMEHRSTWSQLFSATPDSPQHLEAYLNTNLNMLEN